MKAPVYKKDGTSAGEIELADAIFGIAPNDHAIYQAVLAQRAHQRQGTHATRNRSAVSGGNSKPFRQKGTGRARAGSANSPVWVGGGVTFGPKPRSYTEKVNKKVVRLGLKSAYSIKASEEKVLVIEDFELAAPKTKQVADAFKALGIADKKIMFILPGKNDTLVKSVRNLPNCTTGTADCANAYHVANADVLLLTRTSVDRVKESFQHEK